MALWGNRDGKSASGTVTINGTTGGVTGSSTAFTTEARVGDFIRVAGEDYRITAIASNTAATVVAGKPGATMTGRSGDTYTLSEKPKFVSTAESAGSVSGVHGDPTKVFGVSTSLGENYASAGLVVEVAIANAGTGYTEVPSVAFSGGGGSGAAATATLAGESVSAITLTNNGSSYEDVPTVNLDVPRRTIATTAVNISTEVITYNAHGLTTGDRIRYYNGGGTAIAGLTHNTTYYAIRVNANTFKVAATAEDATADTAINLTGTGNNAQYFDLLDETTATAVAALGGGNEAGESESNIAHAGWVRRTVGTGGRAGRVHYETLVAMGSIAGDQSDDRQFPDD